LQRCASNSITNMPQISTCFRSSRADWTRKTCCMTLRPRIFVSHCYEHKIWDRAKTNDSILEGIRISYVHCAYKAKCSPLGRRSNRNIAPHSCLHSKQHTSRFRFSSALNEMAQAFGFKSSRREASVTPKILLWDAPANAKS
jgi:hypothetical protein